MCGVVEFSYRSGIVWLPFLQPSKPTVTSFVTNDDLIAPRTSSHRDVWIEFALPLFSLAFLKSRDKKPQISGFDCEPESRRRGGGGGGDAPNG